VVALGSSRRYGGRFGCAVTVGARSTAFFGGHLRGQGCPVPCGPVGRLRGGPGPGFRTRHVAPEGIDKGSACGCCAERAVVVFAVARLGRDVTAIAVAELICHPGAFFGPHCHHGLVAAKPDLIYHEDPSIASRKVTSTHKSLALWARLGDRPYVQSSSASDSKLIHSMHDLSRLEPVFAARLSQRLVYRSGPLSSPRHMRSPTQRQTPVRSTMLRRRCRSPGRTCRACAGDRSVPERSQ